MLLLQIEGLAKRFGGLVAVNGLNMEVSKGEVVAVIGPNGAGKTTLFNVIAGVYKPTSGKISFNGEDITGLRPDQIAERGIVRTFQLNVVVPSLSVLDHVLLGFHCHTGVNFLQSLLNTPHSRRREREMREQAFEILEFVGLAKKRDELAANLSYGEQKVLNIGQALAANPMLLLLDEPVSGVSGDRAEDIIELIKKTQKEGHTTVLVEHNMGAVLKMCERIMVLDQGEKIFEGKGEEIRANKDVLRVYMGD